MDDFDNKLAGLLDNPESLEKIKSLAGMLMSTEKKEGAEAAKQSSLPAVNKSDSGLDFDPSMLLKIKKVMDMTSTKDDPRINLLMALKPYLSRKRAESMDSAMKILKLTKFATVFTEDFKLF